MLAQWLRGKLLEMQAIIIEQSRKHILVKLTKKYRFTKEYIIKLLEF